MSLLCAGLQGSASLRQPEKRPGHAAFQLLAAFTVFLATLGKTDTDCSTGTKIQQPLPGKLVVPCCWTVGSRRDVTFKQTSVGKKDQQALPTVAQIF